MIQKRIRYTPQLESGTCFALERLFAERSTPLRWKGDDYSVDFRSLNFAPLLCGSPATDRMDLMIGYSLRWHQFSRYLAHTAHGHGVAELNSCVTFGSLDKHHTYDFMARLIAAPDRFPTTVLIPDYMPTTEYEQKKNAWESHQVAIAQRTDFGWDDAQRKTNWDAVRFLGLEARRAHFRRARFKEAFYPEGDYLASVMSDYFENQFQCF